MPRIHFALTRTWFNGELTSRGLTRLPYQIDFTLLHQWRRESDATSSIKILWLNFTSWVDENADSGCRRQDRRTNGICTRRHSLWKLTPTPVPRGPACGIKVRAMHAPGIIRPRTFIVEQLSATRCIPVRLRKCWCIDCRSSSRLDTFPCPAS